MATTEKTPTPPSPTIDPASLEAADDGRRPAGFEKGRAFWLSFLAIMITVFLSALDITAIGTALPTITAELKGGDNFVWVGSAYALSSTAFMPLSGALADAFGRRPIVLLSIGLFALGSALSGTAQNINWLIAARTVQGLGGGAILTLTEILVADLVPLAERGLYQGIIGLVFALACSVGPPIGGAFAQDVSWRWVFYLNLPLCGIAMLVVFFYLSVRTPPGTVKEKLSKVDWFGNALVILGTSVAIVGLTWAGTRYAWSSAAVLVPLIVGLAIIALFLLYEAKVPSNPTIPWEIISNRTSFAAYLATGFHGIISISLVYYLPVYFQASRESSPIRAGVQILPTAVIISPFAFLAGLSAQLLKRYIPSNAAGWILSIVGFGVLSLLRADSGDAQWIGYQFLVGIGVGILYTAPVFPILAPNPVNKTASALAFFGFVRNFSQTWGIAIAATILQNSLRKTLPPAFSAILSSTHGGADLAYASIPAIRLLPEPLREEVKKAFAESMSIVWKAMIGFSGGGLLTVLLMKEVKMHEVNDANYALESEEEKRRRSKDVSKNPSKEGSLKETSPEKLAARPSSSGSN